MEYLKKFNESNTININDIWVIYSSGGFNEVYMNKEEAQKVCDINNKESNEYFKTNKSYYSVVTLDDAIDMIKAHVRDESWVNDSY